MHECVYAQLVRGYETPTAHAARVGALVAVGEHVVLERAGLRERGRAQLTDVRPLSAVNAPVRAQVADTFKRATTHRADVRPRVGVRRLMLAQQLRASKDLVTQQTRHGHRRHVALLVTAQVAGAGEAAATLTTQVRLFASVNANVADQPMSLTCLQTAHIAGVLYNTP